MEQSTENTKQLQEHHFMHISTPNAYTNTEVDYDLAAKANLSTTYTNTRVDSALAATPT